MKYKVCISILLCVFCSRQSVSSSQMFSIYCYGKILLNFFKMQKKEYFFTLMELMDGWSNLLKYLQKYFTLGQERFSLLQNAEGLAPI